MNPLKEQIRSKAKTILNKKGIIYESLNNDLHWKIGSINFYPTTWKWFDMATETEGQGVNEMIAFIKPNKVKDGYKKLTVEQLFEIAKHSKNKSLFGICESIHKEIYK